MKTLTSESYKMLENYLSREYFINKDKYLLGWCFWLEHPEILEIRQIGLPYDAYLKVMSA